MLEARGSKIGVRGSGSRRVVIGVLAVLLAAVVAFVAYEEIRKARFRSQLPPLPTFSHEPTALRDYLENADRAARAAPTSAEAVGALGLGVPRQHVLRRGRLQLRDCGTRWRHGRRPQRGSAYRIPWSYYRALVLEVRGDPGNGGDGARARGRPRARVQSGMVAAWRSRVQLGRRDAAVAAWERARAPPRKRAGRAVGSAPRREEPRRPFRRTRRSASRASRSLAGTPSGLARFSRRSP